ncbi:MAG: hypothetical protein K2Y40_14410 [Reyranella sp.]|nr:hypothetical protein [Reyranella sp.]
MFAALFNVDGRPIDLRPDGVASHAVKILGDRRHVAFICPPHGGVGADACTIEDLEERYWIVGRIRLDARRDLEARLVDQLGGRSGSMSDALLCLHAYAAWGAAFLDRIAGDFCFALWDDRQSRLVCARDQLGVRPLFHAEAGAMHIVGDSLAWIADTAPIDDGLDETWIADFLTIGHCLDFERTVYRQVRRLAPAHVLTISAATAAVHRYWRLELGEPLYLRDPRGYSERFLDLLSRSIADRLPAGKVGISMSGGLDSTTLAACAVAATGDPARIVAECFHFETLRPDDETHFSSLVARHLGIELRLKAIDDLGYDPDWRTRSIRTAEPSASIVCADPERQIAAEQADMAAVWFFGEGPDNALDFERGAYFSWLFERRDWLRLGEAGLLYLLAKGFDGWGTTLGRYLGRRQAEPASATMPPWIDRGLAERVGLQARFDGAGAIGAPRHPWHPRAVASFGDPIWQAVLGPLDTEGAAVPLVWRHPYLDLRVLEFLLSVPPVPWAREKLLMRQAMRGRLPAAVLARRKTPLTPLAGPSPIRLSGLPRLSHFRLADYVDVRRLPAEVPAEPAQDQFIAVHALDYWLTQRRP